MKLRARALVLVMLLACSRSAAPPPQVSARPAAGDGKPGTAEALGAPKWGAPMPDPKVEREAMEMFAVIGSGKAKPDAVFGGAFVIGPALWELLAKDAAFAKIGTPAKSVFPARGTMQVLEMRMYLEAADHDALLASRVFIGFARVVTEGKSRAANDAERSLFYALSPLEIAGRPLTVIDGEKIDVVVYVEDGKLGWIDASDAYNVTPAKP